MTGEHSNEDDAIDAHVILPAVRRDLEFTEAALAAVRVERDALAAEVRHWQQVAAEWMDNCNEASARAAALQTAIEALPERARAMDDQPDKYGVGWADAIRAIRRAAAAVGAVPETRNEKCEHKQRGPHQVLDEFCEWTVDCPGPVPETPEKPE